MTMSLSARRVWIEIGLCKGVIRMVLQSLSARRVWIEIFKISLWYSSNWSLSARRVWIEIPVPCQWHPRCQSLSARRVWIEIAKGRKHLERLSVTLCEESVD